MSASVCAGTNSMDQMRHIAVPSTERALSQRVILFLGAPGSGKGSQANLLSRQLGVTYVSTGDVCRREIEKGTIAGKKLNEYVARGECAPAEETNAVFEAALRRIPCKKGFILDGYPRTVLQIEEALLLLRRVGRRGIERVIFLDTPEDELLRRLQKRRICIQCRCVVIHDEHVLCPTCGAHGSFMQRSDDQDVSVCRRRIDDFMREAPELLRYFEDRDILWRVNAAQTVTKVNEDILDCLQTSVIKGAQSSAYQVLLTELLRAQDVISAARAIHHWLPLAMDENIHKRTGRMRRFVAVVTNNMFKLNEYVRFFDQYGIEVLSVPRQVCEGAHSSVVIHTLLVGCRTNLIVPLGVLREFSNLYKPMETTVATTTGVAEQQDLLDLHSSHVGGTPARPHREFSSLRHGVRAENLSHLTYWYALVSPIPVIQQVNLRQLVTGRIDHTKRSNHTSSIPVFSWDDIFVVDGADRTYAELAGFKISARDRVLSQFVSDHVHYKKRKDLQHFPVKMSRPVDFQTTVESYVKSNRFYQLPQVRAFGITHMIESVLDQGIFFRASANRRQLNYWLPSLNAGIPLTAKSDHIHELTYQVHDMFHFKLPDLTPVHRADQMTQTETTILRQVYIAYRMMSEAITIVLADAVFVEALRRSIMDEPSLEKYDFTKRKIYPLFAATGLLEHLAPAFSHNERVASLLKLLFANVQYVLKGRDDAISKLLSENDDKSFTGTTSVLIDYKTKYSPFFAEDYRWTIHNYDNMVKHSHCLSDWWADTAPLRKGLVCESVQDFYDAMCTWEKSNTSNCGETDLINRIFAFTFQRDVIPALFETHNDSANLCSVIKTVERLRHAFMRYMTGQMFLFSKYQYIAPIWMQESHISLMAHLHKLQSIPANSADAQLQVRTMIDLIRSEYDYVLIRMGKCNLLSPDDVTTYSEVFPIFPSFYVSYDHQSDENENTLRKYHEQVFGSFSEIMTTPVSSLTLASSSTDSTSSHIVANITDQLNAYDQSNISGQPNTSDQSNTNHAPETNTQENVTENPNKYVQSMMKMIEIGDGETCDFVLPSYDIQPRTVTVVRRPGVTLLSHSQSVPDIDVKSQGLQYSSDSNTALEGMCSCTFLFSGVSIETSLELIAHGEASVARLTSSRTMAMNEPLWTCDPDASMELQTKYLECAVVMHRQFNIQHNPRDSRNENIDSVEEHKSQTEWFNVAQGGNKATSLMYTMRLIDYHKLFLGRLPVSGNENGIRHVLRRACEMLHTLYPTTIWSPDTYTCGSNGAKYDRQPVTNISNNQSSYVNGTPLSFSDKDKQERKTQSGGKGSSSSSSPAGMFHPASCRMLLRTCLTPPGQLLLDTMLSNNPQNNTKPKMTDAERLAEFQARITYLSFPSMAKIPSVGLPSSSDGKLYLRRMVHELKHLSIVSAAQATFELWLTPMESMEFMVHLASTCKLVVHMESTHPITGRRRVLLTGSFKQWYIFVQDANFRRIQDKETHKQMSATQGSSSSSSVPYLLTVTEQWLLHVVETTLSREFPLLFHIPTNRLAILQHASVRPELQDVLKDACQLAPYATFINVYRYGSSNYGTSHATSDIDLMIVTDEDAFDFCSISTAKYNMNFYSRKHFATRLKEQRICAIEAVSNPVVEQEPFVFTLDRRQLRASIDHIVWFSLRKAEMKLLGGARHMACDPYVAKKNMFHAYRIAAAAIELCQHGVVQKWDAWREIYLSIMQLPEQPTEENWNNWQTTWKLRIDELMDKFHRLAPKS